MDEKDMSQKEIYEIEKQTEGRLRYLYVLMIALGLIIGFWNMGNSLAFIGVFVFLAGIFLFLTSLPPKKTEK